MSDDTDEPTVPIVQVDPVLADELADQVAADLGLYEPDT